MAKYFKAEAEGDTIYFEAESQDDAKAQMAEKVGPIPDGIVTWTELDALPEDAELM